MPRPHKSHLFVAIGLSSVIAAAIILYDRTSAPPMDAPQGQTGQNNSEGDVFLTITSGVRIPALKENYLNSSSLWVIVSKSRPLTDQTYTPKDLVVPAAPSNPQKSREEQSLRAVVETPLVRMLGDAKLQGHDLFVASGYRSFVLQKQYYDNYVRTSGEAEANMFSAKPGQSEHQTGLAFDLSLASRECYLEICFGKTSAGKWLASHAHDYGFIVRYPENKTDITGYQYEPWHFRYVDTVLARALYQNNLTLDEIAPQLQTAQDALRSKGYITD